MAENAKIKTLHDNDTGDAIAPRTVLAAVDGAQEGIGSKVSIEALNALEARVKALEDKAFAN